MTEKSVEELALEYITMVRNGAYRSSIRNGLLDQQKYLKARNIYRQLLSSTDWETMQKALDNAREVHDILIPKEP